MLVHVKRDELLAIAAQTAKAAPKTATSEAVLGIHVEADSRRSMLTLTATNYEIVIRASMGASVEQSGSVVISAALFPAAIASLPEQDVDLETEHPGQLTIRSGHARFRLSALSGDKYPMPELPFPDDTLPVSGLRSLARNTLFAVAENGVPSPPMKCVRLHVGPDGLKASASNGFCIMEADGDKQCKGQIELLLPARSLKVLASLSNDSDVYEMGVTGKSLVFWSGTLLFSARLVEGKFPNTRGVFEQFKCQYSVHLDAAEFIRALEVAESVSESNHRVELAFACLLVQVDRVLAQRVVLLLAGLAVDRRAFAQLFDCGDQLLFGRSGILQQPARLAAFGQYAEQQMLDRSVLVAERLREVARFLDRLGAFAREVDLAALDFGQSLDLLPQHAAQRADVDAQLLQQENAHAVVLGDDRIEHMQRLDGLIAVRSREVHRALQDFLRFDGQIVDVHIFVSFRSFSDFVSKTLQIGCQRRLSGNLSVRSDRPAARM